MLAYQVQGMTCGHCAHAITQAVLSLDPAAQVKVNLDRHSVHIESETAQDEALRQAIQAAGYDAVLIQTDAGRLPTPPAQRSGCCCGIRTSHCAS